MLGSCREGESSGGGGMAAGIGNGSRDGGGIAVGMGKWHQGRRTTEQGLEGWEHPRGH